MFTFSCEFESFEIPNTIAVPNSAGSVSQKVETSTEKIKNGFNQAYTPFVTENDKTETEDVNGQNVLAIKWLPVMWAVGGSLSQHYRV